MRRITLRVRMNSKLVIYPTAIDALVDNGNLKINYLESADDVDVKSIVWHWDDILWYRVELAKEEASKADDCSDHNSGE